MGNTLNYEVFDCFLEERKINNNISIGITKNGESIRITNNGNSQFYLLIKSKYIYPSKLELYFEENIILYINRINIITNNMYELKYVLSSDIMSTSGIMPEYKKIPKKASNLNLIYSLAAGI